MRQTQGKVYLRGMERTDAADYVRWRNSEMIRKHFIYQEEITLPQQEQWIEKMVLTGRVRQFMIVDSKTDIPIGCVYFHNIDQTHCKAEYGILIGEKEYLGKGYGSEAGSLALKYAFQEMKLNKIYLRVLPGNDRAKESYEKLGFRQEGYLTEEYCINGKFEDVIVMSILKREWNCAGI